MCKCTPEIRTPYCGKGDCVWPEQEEAERASSQFLEDMLKAFKHGREFEFPSSTNDIANGETEDKHLPFAEWFSKYYTPTGDGNEIRKSSIDELITKGRVSQSIKLHYHCDIEPCEEPVHTVQVFIDKNDAGQWSTWHLCSKHNQEYTSLYLKTFLTSGEEK